jgi:hypothetical protein
MSHEKGGKQRASSLKIESSPSSDSEATQEASPVAHRTRKRKAIPKAPLHCHGHGRPNPQGTSAHGAHLCIKRASAPGSHMANA